MGSRCPCIVPSLDDLFTHLCACVCACGVCVRVCVCVCVSERKEDIKMRARETQNDQVL